MGLRSLKRNVKRTVMNSNMKEIQSKILLASADVEEALKREQKQRLEEFYDDEVKRHSGAMGLAMYFMFGIQLHRVYGFGAQRLSRLFQAVDEAMAGFNSGEFSEDDLIKQLYDETGIDYRK